MKDQQLYASVYAHVPLKYLIIAMLPLMIISSSYAQQKILLAEHNADSALARAIKIYDKTIGRNSFLFTGRVYVDKYNGIRGHQYFGEDYWEKGGIIYEGQRFDSIFLMYDIFSDQVILEHFNSGGVISPIRLHNPKISSFDLQGHYFVNLEEDTISGLKEGFYDELFLGEDISIYVRRQKLISKSNQTNDLHEIFTQKDKYYIKKDEAYFRIRGKRDLLKIFKDHKKDIRKHMRRNILSFRREPDRTITSATQFYETL